MTLKDFRKLVNSDIERFAEHIETTLTWKRRISIFFMPSIQALFLYRLNRFLYLRGHRLIPRILFTLNIVIYGTDIPPTTRIGGYFYMPHTVGMTLFGVIGERCTCYAQAAVGGGSGNDAIDLGAGPGLPVIGDNTLIGARAMVVGPIRIGAGSFIGANTFITEDLPENSTVVAKSNKPIA